MRSFNRGSTEGTNSSEKKKFDVCVCMFCFMFAKWLVLWTDDKGFVYIYEKGFETCICF